jgi:hypothetical protein
MVTSLERAKETSNGHGKGRLLGVSFGGMYISVEVKK